MGAKPHPPIDKVSFRSFVWNDTKNLLKKFEMLFFQNKNGEKKRRKEEERGGGRR